MKLRCLLLDQMPIEQQLRIEEGLLRTSDENWFILNNGSIPSVIMGLSSKPEEWVDLARLHADNIPLLQRFSGGGTVFVDHNTLFGTFILNQHDVGIDPFPQPILEWTADVYRSALQLENFSLCENDYVLGDRKIGGNAQYLQKNRWLHHTTFLFDYEEKNMGYLLHPKRQPTYRRQRPHHEFLTKLKPLLSKEDFITRLVNYLHSHYQLEQVDLPPPFPSHRTTMQKVTL